MYSDLGDEVHGASTWDALHVQKPSPPRPCRATPNPGWRGRSRTSTSRH